MSTGIINSDNFADIMRQISQRRRQGILDLVFTEVKAKISFQGGKIVEAQIGNLSPVAELVEWLIDANVITDEVRSIAPTTYSHLFPLLTTYRAPTARPIDEKWFRSLIRHRTMERIFRLPLQQGAIFSFSPELIETDRGFSPSISVGQLLLDMVALESDEENFERTFGGDCLVARTSEVIPPQLSLDEKHLLELIGTQISVPTLARRSLMSSYHFRETLMALHHANLIEKVEAVTRRAPEPAPHPTTIEEPPPDRQIEFDRPAGKTSATRASTARRPNLLEPEITFSASAPSGLQTASPSSEPQEASKSGGRKRRVTDVFRRMNFFQEGGQEDLDDSPILVETNFDTHCNSHDDSSDEETEHVSRPVSERRRPAGTPQSRVVQSRVIPRLYQPQADAVGVEDPPSRGTVGLSGRNASILTRALSSNALLRSSQAIQVVYWVLFGGSLVLPLLLWRDLAYYLR